uniref:Clp ATPase C-terminal domain-containing protein n=1 Tax=Brassica oleracea var. oleracea TaxID=109376 RepID=A0A0D3AMH7_BRAOL
MLDISVLSLAVYNHYNRMHYESLQKRYELMMLKLVGKLGPREKPTGLQPKQADDDMVELEKRRQYSDTKDILFICGGAFVDIEKPISERVGAPVRANMRSGGVSIAAVASNLMETVESSDLIAYGLIPEFLGRFPVLVSLSALTENQLIQVLTEPKNALGKQYKKMYQMNSVKLHFTETALRLLARKAITKNTGARGLRPLLESILMDSIKQLKEKGRRGSGAKILRGKGALVLYLSEAKSTYSPQLQTTKEGSEGEKEVEQEIPSVVASM